nr:immunoglobulin heavy chain junction region [Macaca mulatta]MOW19031.1 immunoglobulin heavy chain junction region [Macaca mulatta]MOW19183.1 immunoglobulin heavy chain junction region [Macaca mulatta]MOW19334.1 immunoglobulin heavy chain junction region [Macaca mulatta]MOW20144.1 immunoglobulin heavy chain junction region [Macaca mulatta]
CAKIHLSNRYTNYGLDSW